MTKTMNRTLPTLKTMEELLVGLTSDPNVLRQWMVSGPEVAKTIVEFKDVNLQLHNHDEYSHHEQSHRV